MARNRRYLPWIGAAISHGPRAALAASLAVTPGAVWMLALVLERRRIGLRGEFTALALGDPLLAVALALGVRQMGGRPPSGLAARRYGLVSMTGWLGFGLLQWRAELRDGYFTREQAMAPTKIWHQLVVYPLLGYWLWTALVAALTARGAERGGRAPQVAMLACVTAWIVANGYDRRRPKLGHPPYEWRRLRPRTGPWPATSTTLRAYRASGSDNRF